MSGVASAIPMGLIRARQWITIPFLKRRGVFKMPGRSSSSVNIYWLDSQRVVESLKAVARQMRASHPEIEQVLLFGSLARGEAAPGSDADLLVILSSSTQPFLERIPRYLPVGLPVGVDVFPYTREEIDRMLAEGNLFIRQATQEGIALA